MKDGTTRVCGVDDVKQEVVELEDGGHCVEDVPASEQEDVTILVFLPTWSQREEKVREGNNSARALLEIA